MIFRKASWLLSGLAVSLVAGPVSTAWAGVPEFGWTKERTFRSDDLTNSPLRLEPDFKYAFNAVPSIARVPDAMMPYGDTYWPSNRGGIAYRWNQKDRAHTWIDPYLIEMSIKYALFAPAPNSSEVRRMESDAKAILDMLFTKSEQQLSSSFNNLNPNDSRVVEAAPLKRLRQRIAADAKSVFSDRSPSLQELRSWTASQVAQLSPSEKYDIFRGDYKYGFTRSVRSRYSVHDAYWEGICHGWAPASVNHSEPQPVTMTNNDGITIPFGSADVKALLDFMYADVNYSSNVRQMGDHCKTNLKVEPNGGGSRCEDVNAGAFHVVTTNYIGDKGQAYVADLYRGHEMWNNPVYAYDFKVTGKTDRPMPNSAKGTVKNYRIHMTALTPSDDQRLPPQWNPITAKYDAQGNRLEAVVPDVDGFLDIAPFDGKYAYEELEYDYWLDINAHEEIIGGSWISQDRPDFIWMKNELSFSGQYAALAHLYKPTYSRGQRADAKEKVRKANVLRANALRANR